ncbi:MAG: M20/M25/M40 family metallo-hydrolase [Candidatus Gastranaerophilales bacterium]|nr:M20/M25/M40 family metallo-hydrolase [Candidatus Gastranaerophilales bacterium]
MDLIQIFETLVKIPSPSLHEDKVADKVIEILTNAGIFAKKDDYGNVYAKVDAVDKTKPSFMLSSHMDVVGDNSPVNIIKNGDFLETDKKRTLGADDKSGVAAAVKLALDIAKMNGISHGGLEITLTRDEENNMTGIENVQFDQINSSDVLVLDSDKLGNFEISGAGYSKLNISVITPFGGHSGLDIADKTKLNAAKLIAELVNEIPQGVYCKNELGVITSINLGSIVAGGVDNSIYQAVENNIAPADAAQYVCFKSMSNLINTKAYAHYSLRSSDTDKENELTEKIQKIIDNFNEKYKNSAHANMEKEIHLPVFKEAKGGRMIEIAKRAAKNTNVDIKVQSFHAGAETHIYANRKNKSNNLFKPVLVGIADIYNMHSPMEKIDIKSYLKGYDFLKEIFLEYNK